MLLTFYRGTWFSWYHNNLLLCSFICCCISPVVTLSITTIKPRHYYSKKDHSDKPQYSYFRDILTNETVVREYKEPLFPSNVGFYSCHDKRFRNLQISDVRYHWIHFFSKICRNVIIWRMVDFSCVKSHWQIMFILYVIVSSVPNISIIMPLIDFLSFIVGRLNHIKQFSSKH